VRRGRLGEGATPCSSLMEEEEEEEEEITKEGRKRGVKMIREGEKRADVTEEMRAEE